MTFFSSAAPRQSAGMNIAGLLVITLWTVGLCSIMFGLLNGLGLLRVDRQSEIVGMDIVKHGEPAYPVAAYGGDYRHLQSPSKAPIVNSGVPIIMPSISDFKVKGTSDGRDNRAYMTDSPSELV